MAAAAAAERRSAGGLRLGQAAAKIRGHPLWIDDMCVDANVRRAGSDDDEKAMRDDA
jgi:hypothetical protein